MNLDLGAVPSLHRAARLFHDPVRGADVLLLPERVVRLNSSAAAVVSLCDGSRSVAEIVNRLRSEHGATDPTAGAALQDDVLEMLADLRGRGWILT